MLYLGQRTAGTTVYVPFHTFNSSGASVTISGLAVTDIEIYKNGSTTQRSSDNGYTLLDTDGIDYDGLTGLHGFSIDLSDNSDTGFFSAGNFYMVAVSTVTVDGQTVSFWAACFDVVSAPATLADINAEVVDCLNVDTYPEPGQGAPPASPTIRQMIHYQYKLARNKSTQTADTLSVYADGGTTVDHKATVSDDGTTATRGELATGP